MRIAMLVLAFVYAALAMLTAAVGSFADGGDIWSRLVLVLLHPLAAGALLLLVLRSTASRKLVLAIAALLLATVAADLFARPRDRQRRNEGRLGTPRDLRRRSHPWIPVRPAHGD